MLVTCTRVTPRVRRGGRISLELACRGTAEQHERGMRTIDDWLTHWRDKREELVEHRRAWEEQTGLGLPADRRLARERVVDLDRKIAHQDRVIARLVEKQRSRVA